MSHTEYRCKFNKKGKTMKKLFFSIIATAFLFSFTATADHANKDLKYKLVDSKGKKVKPELASKEYIVLYYSASWCPPCQKFTPDLVKYYNEMKKAKGSKMPFEVILVTSDRSENAMLGYMKSKKMPWPAIDFGKESKIDVVKKNSPRGIPYIAVLDKDGKAVIKDNAFAALPKLKKLIK